MRHLSVCFTALALLGATTHSLDAQLVRGQVVDSVLSLPVSAVTVVLLDASETEVSRTITDEEGLFLLRAPAGEAGEYRLRAALEGYRTSTFPPFALDLDNMPAFRLLLPNLLLPDPPRTWEEVAETFCEEGLPREGQGVILGFVVDASETPVTDARITLSWRALRDELADLVTGGELGRLSREFITDSTGFYAACRVPGEVQIMLHAARDDLFSDYTRVEFTKSGVVVDEEFVANRQVWRHDFELSPPEDRSAGVTGMVLDALDMQPVPDATVGIAGTNLETTTDSRGVFRLTELPAGPAQLAIRRPGSRPILRDVDLTHGKTVSFPPGAFRLAAAPTELDPVVVEAATATRGRLAGFYERRSSSGGAFVTREEWERRGSPRVSTDIVRRMQGIRVLPNLDYAAGGPRWLVVMGRGEARVGGYGSCPSLIYLDGQYLGNSSYVLIDETIFVESLEAVEAHRSIASLPPEFNRRGAECGVILFWTR